jgi:hypothetical protein
MADLGHSRSKTGVQANLILNRSVVAGFDQRLGEKKTALKPGRPKFLYRTGTHYNCEPPVCKQKKLSRAVLIPTAERL